MIFNQFKMSIRSHRYFNDFLLEINNWLEKCSKCEDVYNPSAKDYVIKLKNYLFEGTVKPVRKRQRLYDLNIYGEVSGG